jgi:hypothetical protein
MAIAGIDRLKPRALPVVFDGNLRRSYSASVNDVAIGHGENDRLNRVR